jgi:predicted MarR family transcription regulator
LNAADYGVAAQAEISTKSGRYQGKASSLRDIGQAVNLHGLHIDNFQLRRLDLRKITCQTD